MLAALRFSDTVLRLAKEEGRMHDIECITLFINSIANECMTEEEERRYHELLADPQGRIVVEITEAEHLDMELIRKKSSVESFSGMFAWDDYGSGYNSEINLPERKPKFVKVDISIVRDVDKDVNKQQIISNIVDYAHKGICSS